MKYVSGYQAWLLPLLGILLAVLPVSDVEARKQLFGSRSGSSAWIEIRTTDPNRLADALVDVFQDDGYYLQSESESRMRFSRLASRMQELSYGSFISPGSVESVSISFFPISESRYRVECNVTR